MNARTPLPHRPVADALAGVVDQHGADPERCGLEAWRVLRGAGLTWRDVFEPVSAREPEFRETSNLAACSDLVAAAFARSVLLHLHLATAAQLARLAAVVCRCPRPPEELHMAEVILRRLGDDLFQECLWAVSAPTEVQHG